MPPQVVGVLWISTIRDDNIGGVGQEDRGGHCRGRAEAAVGGWGFRRGGEQGMWFDRLMRVEADIASPE